LKIDASIDHFVATASREVYILAYKSQYLLML